MNGLQLRVALIRLFGEEDWRRVGAERLGISISTLDRQANGHVPVTGPVKAAVEAWTTLANIRAKNVRRIAAYRAKKREPNG